jgi:serine/threonine-protein kinase
MDPNNVAVAVPGDLATGSELAGRYRIRSVLARGGMGVIYDAEHLALKCDVAIKTLKPVLLADPDAVARFTREARLAASIGHPGIVTVFDLASDQGITFLAMERLQGEDVRNRLLRTGPFAIVDVVRIARELADAIAAAHERGVLHRDLSPRNVFLHEAFGRKSVKVLDFGIAKLTEPRLAEGSTQSQQVVGTLLYMAPERLAGDPAVDARVDVYGIGAILYEATSGEPPFNARTYSELVLKIALEQPLPLQARRPDAPAALIRVIERALHKDPSARWPSVSALAQALAQLDVTDAVGERCEDAIGELHATVTSPRPQLPRPQRNAFASPRLVATLLAACLSVALALAFAHQPNAQAERATSATRVRAQPARPAEPLATRTGLGMVVASPVRLPDSARSAAATSEPAPRQLAIITIPAGALVSAAGATCTAPCSIRVTTTPLTVQARLPSFRTARRRVASAVPERLVLRLERASPQPDRSRGGVARDPLPALLPL